METNYTHWKKLCNPNYMGSYSFQPNQDITVTILSVSREMVVGTDGKKEECTVAKLKDNKPLILNSTNCKTISAMLGTPYIENWKNKRVTLYVAKVKAFGEIVEAIRIRPEAPELPVLNPNSANWEEAKKSVKSGIVKIEQIRKHYQITPEDEKQLQD